MNFQTSDSFWANGSKKQVPSDRLVTLRRASGTQHERGTNSRHIERQFAMEGGLQTHPRPRILPDGMYRDILPALGVDIQALCICHRSEKAEKAEEAARREQDNLSTNHVYIGLR